MKERIASLKILATIEKGQLRKKIAPIPKPIDKYCFSYHHIIKFKSNEPIQH